MARNILFIMFSQLRHDYLSGAGHKTLLAPHKDRLVVWSGRMTKRHPVSDVKIVRPKKCDGVVTARLTNAKFRRTGREKMLAKLGRFLLYDFCKIGQRAVLMYGRAGRIPV